MQAKISGLSTNYSVQGNGPVAVVIHGWGTNYENMRSIIDSLAESYTVYALDLPGFGGSQQPESTWGVGDYAEFIKSFLDELNVEKIDLLVGHSLGGRISIKAVANHILSPSKLILIGSAGVKHSASLKNRIYKVIAKIGKFVLSIPGLNSFSATMREKLYQAADSTDYLKAGSMQQIFLKVIDEDLSQDATKVAIPSLLIWGANDDQVPLSDARFFHKVMANSTLKIIQQTGHFVHNEAPARVNRLIKGFLV